MRRFAFVVGTAAVLALMLAIGGPAYAGTVQKPVTYYVNDDAAGEIGRASCRERV